MKLVIFDCDGTLVDSQHLIVSAMNSAFAANGIALLEPRRVLSIVGLSLPLAIERLLPGAPTATISAVTDAYRDAFFELRRNPDLNEPLYPGVRDVLDRLRERDDVVLGIATGKSRRGVDRVLAHHGLEGRFTTIQTADDHPSKPHPSMVLRALVEAGAEPEAAVMIGDTTYDVEMGLAARVTALGVGWGYHPPAALAQAGAHEVLADAAGLAARLDRFLATAAAIGRDA